MPASRAVSEAVAAMFATMIAALRVRRGIDPMTQLATYADALADLSPSLLPRVAREIIQQDEYFPSVARIRLVYRGIRASETTAMVRADSSSVSVRSGGRVWDWSPDSPCPTCGARPEIELERCRLDALDDNALEALTAREKALVFELTCCREEGHRHGWFTAPPCPCWDGSGHAPPLRFSLERYESLTMLPKGWGEIRRPGRLRGIVSSPARAALVALALGRGASVPHAIKALAAEIERAPADEQQSA